MEKIGVFCSACQQIDDIYFETARQLGEWMGRNGKTLVFGGSNLGVMDCIAQAVKTAGGKVFGVVPEILEQRGCVSSVLDVNFACVNLSDRKDIMIEESDIIVALPGGIGTLDEIFTVASAHSIGYHDREVVLYNVDGFWNPLMAMLDEMEQKGFMRHGVASYLKVVDTFDELTKLLE